MTIGWLRTVLDRFGNDDAQVFINISGTMFPLCGSVDKSILVYELKSEPGLLHGEEVLTLKPCECSSKEEDDNKGKEFLN